MDYTELQQEVTDWSHRTDLAPKMDSFSIMAEALINKDLRTREMEVRLPVTFTDTFYDLPPDYMEMRALELQVRGGRSPLQQMTPQQLDVWYSRSNSSPVAFAIHGGQIEFAPGIDATAVPPVTYDGEISYYGRVPDLVTNLTNTVLDQYPLIYLSAMMINVHIYVQDKEETATWTQLYNSQISAANKSAEGGRYVTPTVGIV